MGVKWLGNLSQLMDAILLLAPIINRRNVAGLDWVSVPEPHYTASPSSVLRHLPGCSTYRSGIFGESQYCFSYLISVRSYNYYDGYPILVQLVWEWSGDEAMVCAALTGSGCDGYNGAVGVVKCLSCDRSIATSARNLQIWAVSSIHHQVSSWSLTNHAVCA